MEYRKYSRCRISLACYAVDFLIAMWGKDFNPEAHSAIICGAMNNAYQPTVDVLLPVCKEPTVLLANTWDYVAALDYRNVVVHVLDDGADDAVRELAAKYGFRCKLVCIVLDEFFSRPVS